MGEIKRQARGTSAGGQFAAHARSEAMGGTSMLEAEPLRVPSDLPANSAFVNLHTREDVERTFNELLDVEEERGNFEAIDAMQDAARRRIAEIKRHSVRGLLVDAV